MQFAGLHSALSPVVYGDVGRQFAAGNSSSCSLRQLARACCGKHLEMCAPS